MSSTRKAQPGSPLKQNRFASSPDIERGLLGNLVAIKCATVESAEDCELLFWLQHTSHATGGLAVIADQVLQRCNAANAGVAGTRSLEELEDTEFVLQQQIAEIKAQRDEQRSCYQRACENYDGETPLPQLTGGSKGDRVRESALIARLSEVRLQIQQSRTLKDLDRLPELLAEFCLNPKIPVADGWPAALPNLCSVLRELKTEHEKHAEADFTHTEVSRLVRSAIADAHQLGGMVLLNNEASIGKSFAAKSDCAVYPGRARYSVVQPSNVETEFWRDIAKSLGNAYGQTCKCHDLRSRVIETLVAARAVLVLDNCQNLFPVADFRYAAPHRANWVKDIIEKGIPVIMISRNSIFKTMGLVEARTGWSRSEFMDSLSIVALPSKMPLKDVRAVAAVMLPGAEIAAIHELANYMINSPGYLKSGSRMAQRACRIAAQRKDECVSLEDMNQTLDVWGHEALESLKDAIAQAERAAGKCKSTGRDRHSNSGEQTSAKDKRRNPIVTSCDLTQSAPSSLATTLQPSGSRAADEQFSDAGGKPRVGVRSGRGVIPADLETV